MQQYVTDDWGGTGKNYCLSGLAYGGQHAPPPPPPPIRPPSLKEPYQDLKQASIMDE